MTILSVAVAWYFHESATGAQRERDDLTNAREELIGRIRNLEQEKAAVSNRLEAQIASSSREKQQELDGVRSTYDTLVTALKSEIKQGQVTITKMADWLWVRIVDKILFSSGETDITTQGTRVLVRVGKVLKNTEKQIIYVEGHTDNVPVSSQLSQKLQTNWEFSKARATNVARFLQDEADIAPARLQAVGMSEFHPVTTNKPLVRRSQNRRIEIALLPHLGELPSAVKSRAKE